MATSFRNLFWSGLNNLGAWFDWIYRQVSWKLPRGKLFAPTECEGSKTATRPTSVNYHFTRQCNYQCGFCFHTAKSSYVLPIDEAMRGLRLLQEAGMEKINFSGGEPFIHQKGKYVGELVRFCKRQLKLDSVTIVSNGSLITEDWFIRYGEDLDILAISCDSFRPKTNELIGRRDRCPSHTEDDHSVGERHLQSLERVRSWCRDYKVAFKINTVVNALNFDEDMNRHIQQLNPVRWKVFQCLLVGGENQGEKALRDAQQLVVTDDQFEAFLQRHDQIGCLVPESNSQMRFLDCSAGQKIPSPSLLDVGVANAMERSGFDEQMFFKRGGKYVWSKSDMSPDLLDW